MKSIQRRKLISGTGGSNKRINERAEKEIEDRVKLEKWR